MLRADARVVEAGRDRVRLDGLAVLVLEHERARAVQHAALAGVDRRRVPAGLEAVAARPRSRRSSTSASSRNAVNRPIALDPPPTQAAIASGSPPYCSRHWARASSPMPRQNSRTMLGNGCGPAAVPKR